MPQIFHPSANTIARVSIFGALLFLGGGVFLVWWLMRTPYMNDVGVIREQPVPFSHQHHVDDVGLDCRFCHASVENSSFAGVPPTKTCMRCHSQLFADSPMLAPVRESYDTGQPLVWTRVHDLPDYAHFDHSIHVHKGMSCATCHGRVDRMPLMWRAKPLTMAWCLECHRAPGRFVQPRDRAFDPSAVARGEPHSDCDALVKAYGLESKTSCSICHY